MRAQPRDSLHTVKGYTEVSGDGSDGPGAAFHQQAWLAQLMRRMWET
jgi:hypothetical protein